MNNSRLLTHLAAAYQEAAVEIRKRSARLEGEGEGEAANAVMMHACIAMTLANAFQKQAEIAEREAQELIEMLTGPKGA